MLYGRENKADVARSANSLSSAFAIPVIVLNVYKLNEISISG